MSESSAKPPRPLVLCVLDGWGLNPEEADNAVAQADTPVMDRLWQVCPHATLLTHGENVGLPAGQMGNSEVGHMNLGAGRVVMQELPRIDGVIDQGRLGEAPALRDLVAKLKASGGTAHVMGLLSPGGVHSHQRHMAALASVLLAEGIPVAIHAFTDGRDTPPMAAAEYLKQFRAQAPNAPIATISGRYYAMDRDRRWERIAKAYDVLVDAKGEHAPDAETAIERQHLAGTGDEFILPTVIGDYRGMADGDGVVMANFRADRVREILQALVEANFDGFARPRVARFAATAGMVRYSDELASAVPSIFPPHELGDVFGELVARAGLRQLRIAETEKYPHVTYFFNGGRETVFDGEERILVPSPKVATYDQKPEMSAVEVTERLEEVVRDGRFDVIVVNYANGDMVGHTGDVNAAVRAVETVDGCLGRLVEVVTTMGGALLVTADHGNAELMRDPDTGGPHTAHTKFPVPIVLTGGPEWITGLRDGRLADVAPTLLALLGLEQPAVMTGRSLLAGGSPREEAPTERASA